MIESTELHPPEIIPPKVYKTRSVKVSLYPEFRPRTPWVRLKGLWLAEAGFVPGTQLRIEVRFGCMVITPQK